MKRHNVPATFFVTTELVGNQRLFYRNLVALCLHRMEMLRDEELHELGLGSTTRVELAAKLRALPRAREDEIQRIADRLGVDRETYLREKKPYLTVEHIEKMVRDGFVFGAHGRFHDDLGTADPEMLRAEVVESCRVVRDWTGQDTVSFAFPHQHAPQHAEVLADIRASHPWIRGWFARSEGRNVSLTSRWHGDDPDVPLESILRKACRRSRRSWIRGRTWI